MITAVWFSHPPDYGKLARSMARVRELDPAVACRVVIEAAHRPPDIDAEVVTAEFSRGSHLDGAAAALGVARALAAVPAGLVVKLDSDMLLEAAFWQHGPTVFVRPNQSHPGIYALPARVLSLVAASMDEIRPFAPHEAIAICSRARVIAHALGIPIATMPINGRVPPFVVEAR